MRTPTLAPWSTPEMCSGVLSGAFPTLLAAETTSWLGRSGASSSPKLWNGEWPHKLGWLYIISDLAIFVASLSLTLVVVHFLIRRRSFPFPRLFGILCAIVLSSGVVHFVEAVTFWHPVHWLAGLLNVVMAVLSWVAVALAVRVLPKALKLSDVDRFNSRLQSEMWERLQVEGELRRSELEARKLAMIASRTDNGVILTDRLGRIEWTNDGFTRISGYNLDEVKGHSPGALLQGPETDSAVAKSMGDHLKRGDGFRFEILNYSKDGRKYWVHINAQPIFDDHGNLTHFMAVLSDITERKESEAALIALNDELEERVRERTLELGMANDSLRHEISVRRRTESALIQRTCVATIAADVGGSMKSGATLAEALGGCVEAYVEHLDVAFARIWTLEEASNTLVLQASAGMYTHTDGPHGRVPMGRLKIGQIAAEGKAHLINDIPSDPQIGDRAWAKREGLVAFAGFPLFADGRVIGVLAMFSRRPISEVLFSQLNPISDSIANGIARIRTEENLRRSEERFYFAARATNEVIWDWDSASASITWSDGLLGLIGGCPEEIGASREWWEGRVHSEDLDRMRDGFRAAIDDDVQIWSSEYRVRRSDGSFVHVLDRGFIVRSPEGRPVRVIGAILDLTDRIQAELEIYDLTQRMEAEQEIRDLNVQLEQRLNRLDALRRIDVAIAASLDLGLTLGIVIDQVQTHLKVDAAAILMGDAHDQSLTYMTGKGFRTREIAASHLRPGEGYAGLAMTEQRLVAVTDLENLNPPFVRQRLLSSEGFVSYHAVPLMARGHVQGVLEVYHRHPFEPDQDWLSFLETLAGQAAIAVDNAHLLRDLQRSHSSLVAAYDATIEGWARAIDLRDKETEGHTRRVTEMTLKLGRAMGLNTEELVHMRRGALLHDIGKLGIPDAILLKPGKLTEEEWKIMRLHPSYAHEWLAPISFLKPAMDIPYCHHEKWDGTGYPRGLKAEQIPLSARIFAAVDIWDALRSDRPYRKGWPEPQVIEHLQSIAGTHLDPVVVKYFLQALSDSGDRLDLTTSLDPELDERLKELQHQLEEATGLIHHLELQGRELKQANLRLTDLSQTDELTGLKNRRHIRENFEVAFSNVCSKNEPLSLVMLDVDHFKSFNDEHGHRAGDEVLKTLATILQDQVRPDDIVARYGGEEFMILLPNTDAQTSYVLAGRIRVAIAAHSWPNREVTASFGVATTGPSIQESFGLIEAADIALYQSKAAGRDRVTHYQETLLERYLKLADLPMQPSLDSVA